jgi:DNA-binding SARP family transcriptional activator
MRLRVLGGLELTSCNGVPVDDATRQTRLMLACLALAGGKGLTRAELCAVFWPDRPSSRARNSLRQGLAAIRKTLSADDIAMSLQADLEVVRLVAAPERLDVVAFRDTLQKDNRDGWIAAARAYGGPLLAGVEVSEEVEHFLASHRRALAEQASLIAERLSQADAVDVEALDAAHALAQRLLQSDPASEEAHRALMRVFIRRGRTNAALRQFEQCKEALLWEMQSGPDLETKRLFTSIHRTEDGRLDNASEAKVSTQAGTAVVSSHAPR